jgi:hypothetical protein
MNKSTLFSFNELSLQKGGFGKDKRYGRDAIRIL